jgi:hypothetical protein
MDLSFHKLIRFADAQIAVSASHFNGQSYRPPVI